jgi:hypothetical protein
MCPDGPVSDYLECPVDGTGEQDGLQMGAVVLSHRISSSLKEKADLRVCAVDRVFEKVPGELWTSQKRVLACVHRLQSGSRLRSLPDFQF